MRFLILISLFSLFTPITWAGGSSFSAVGFGLPQGFRNGRSAGMGGLFIALPSGNYINYYNPSALMGLNMVRFDGLIFYEGLGISTGAQKAFSSTANVGSASIGIPFGQRLAASLSLYRFSRVEYDYTFRDNSFEGATFTEKFSGTGGIQSLTLSLAGQINDRWSAGASAHYMFGTIDRRWIVNWDDDAFVDTEDRLEEHIQGARWTLGATYDHGRYRIGSFVSTAATFSNDVTGYSAEEDTIALANRDMDFPFEFGIGGLVRIDERYRAGMDLLYTGWKGTGLAGSSSDFRNTWRINIGGERQGSDNIAATWLERLDYRVGFYFQNLYVENTSGKAASEFFVTTGVGFPFGRGRHSMDIGFEIGKRGSIADNRVRDYVYRVTLSISAGEKWFQKRRRR